MRDEKNGARMQAPKAESADILGANSEIGRKLRQYYDGLIVEDVPDRFTQLLQQLDRVETARKAK